MAFQFDRAIQVLNLLALTLPAIAIYMQVIRRRLEDQRDTDDAKEPYKKILLFSEISLILLLAGLSGILFLVFWVSPDQGMMNSIDSLSAFVVLLGYIFWLIAIVKSVYEERRWLER